MIKSVEMLSLIVIYFGILDLLIQLVLSSRLIMIKKKIFLIVVFLYLKLSGIERDIVLLIN